MLQYTLRRSRYKKDYLKNNEQPNSISTYNPKHKYQNIPKIQFYTKEFINEKHNESMEDIITIIKNFNNDPNKYLFCLFDGHCGNESAKFSSEKFPKIFQESLKKNSNNIEKSLTESFLKLDELTKEIEDFLYIGNTATIIYIDKNTIYSANVGDTRSVLICYDKPIRLTYDHKCSDESEKKRIIKAGGIIRKNRLNCDLAISRAIGDNEYKKFGLIANPYICKKNLSYNEKYCVIASDGIWDFVCDETVYNIGMMCDHGNEFCEKLINVAINVGSKDNISCIVISFRE